VALVGAGFFGAVVGWYLYYINRYRTGEVQLGDLVTVVGALGGGAILALFPSGTDLFGAYGIGLAAGFFAYLIVLAVLVGRSPNFDRDFFLDGRRKQLPSGWEIPAGGRGSGTAMGRAAGPGARERETGMGQQLGGPGARAPDAEPPEQDEEPEVRDS
jgi:hypothetical protein